MSKMKDLTNEKGHTLIEMTIVLVIVTIASSISFVSFKGAHDAALRNQFITQLQQDLYYAQQRAISDQTITSVRFLNGNKEYVISQSGKVILKRGYQYPNTSFVQGTLSLHDIAFLANGNARKSGTLIIRMGEKSYRLVLLLGRGRFYIDEM